MTKMTKMTHIACMTVVSAHIFSSFSTLCSYLSFLIYDSNDINDTYSWYDSGFTGIFSYLNSLFILELIKPTVSNCKVVKVWIQKYDNLDRNDIYSKYQLFLFIFSLFYYLFFLVFSLCMTEKTHIVCMTVDFTNIFSYLSIPSLLIFIQE